MESLTRKPLQGVSNIIRFNWHFYILAILFIAALYMGQLWLISTWKYLLAWLTYMTITSLIISLIVSFYIYDLSGLYKLAWLKKVPPDFNIVNIHAGFDETSALLAQKFPESRLTVFDFFDEKKHTEVSIRRARKVYPAYPDTKTIDTNRFVLPASETDIVFCILSVHEIRNRDERIRFFQQLVNTLTSGGRIIVVEHLRDWANFISYTIGCLHFHSEKEWRLTFLGAGLTIEEQSRINPFITVFTLQKHGTTS